MKPELILLPVFTLIALTFVMMLWMAILRFKVVGEKTVPARYFKTYQGDIALPDSLSQVTRHFHNLLETPTLFYAVIAFILILGKVDILYIYLSWIYVFIRLMHAFVHVTYNHLLHRSGVFFLSCVVLIMMWSRLFLQIVN